MIADGLIRQGRIFVEVEKSPGHIILQVSDIKDVKAKNFFRRVFLVEIAPSNDTDSGFKACAHPYAAWGSVISRDDAEDFVPDVHRARGIPFSLPRGNPLAPQGRYPVPVYIVYDKQFAGFKKSMDGLKKFFKGRFERTLNIMAISDQVLDQIVSVLGHQFEQYEGATRENRLGIIVLALVSEDGPYGYATEIKQERGDEQHIILAPSLLYPEKKIVARLNKILPLVWAANEAEGAEKGVIKNGICSFCAGRSNVVSIYAKAWPWFTTTWTGPLPQDLNKKQLVEGVALCSQCYAALTYGAKIFSGLTQQLPNWLTKEIFSPDASRAGKDQARRSTPAPIYGGVLVLPVFDEFLKDELDKKIYTRSIGQMQAKERGSTLDRHLDTVVGFDLLLPEDLEEDIYRLTLLYYSGDPSKGDIHLMATIEDVLPSVASKIDEMLRELAEQAVALRQSWYVDTSASAENYLRRSYASLPYLLTTAYGSGYLWQSLASVLHRHPLSADRFIRNVASREQELTKKLPDTILQLREEVMFYEMFRLFLQLYRERVLLNTEGGWTMRPWQELQQLLVATPIQQLQFEDVEELGFACGHVVRHFSRWYWHRTKVGERGKDFLKDRVMTFGSSLTPDIIWQRALSRFEEYAMKVSPGEQADRLGNKFRQRYGLILAEYSRLRADVNRNKDRFMAAFWSGYALQDLAPKSDDSASEQPAQDAEQA